MKLTPVEKEERDTEAEPDADERQLLDFFLEDAVDDLQTQNESEECSNAAKDDRPPLHLESISSTFYARIFYSKVIFLPKCN
jgi:hypothetical protein